LALFDEDAEGSFDERGGKAADLWWVTPLALIDLPFSLVFDVFLLPFDIAAMADGRPDGHARQGGTAEEPPGLPVPEPVVLPANWWTRKEMYYQGAKVGDFVEYERDGTRIRRVVIEKGDRKLVEERGEYTPAKLPAQSVYLLGRIEYRFTGPDREPAKPDPNSRLVLKESRETLNVAGRDLDCRRLETFDGQRSVEVNWFCEDVPLGGWVGSAPGGSAKPTVVLTKFGRGK
jgi:hypothetical protein